MLKRRRVIHAICLVCVFVLAQFVSASAQPSDLTLQPPVADPSKPAETSRMSYQPPDDADGIDDFLPAGAQLRNATLPSDSTPTRIEIGTDRDTAVSINNGQLGIIVESDTFTQSVDLVVSDFTREVLPPGFENGQKPAGTTGNHPAAGPLVHFQLEMTDEAGSMMETFAKHTRIVVDLRDYGLDLDEVGGAFYLAYEDEDNPGEWKEAPITYHGRTGLISAEVTHFSDWQSGWRPEAWALEWKPPVVNEFTGAASYQYPINVPRGRNGLQPGIGLSYSSASLRGAIRQVSFGAVAAGWSLSDISITRTGIENGASSWTYPDTFRLTFNGTGGLLVRVGTESGAAVYRVEDMPRFKVYNYGGRTWDENQDGNSYWVVRDSDGIHYRLGYTSDAITYQGADSLDEGDSYDDIDIVAWHVDTVTDAFGNQLNYEYMQVKRTENWGFWCPWGGVCQWSVDTYTSQVTSIKYNFDDHIVSLPPAPTVARLGDQVGNTPASKVTFTYNGEENRLSTINVYHGSGAHPVRKYVISATTKGVDSPSVCDEFRVQYNDYITLTTHTRIIDWIEEQAWDSVQNTLVATLPRTTFSYQSLPHFTEEGEGCFYVSVQRGESDRVDLTR